MFTTVLLYTLAGFAAAQTGDLDVPVGTMSPTRPVPPTSKTVILTTKTVTELTTYCPKPTEITMGSSTYTVTVATTLTITDCPCTVVEVSFSLYSIQVANTLTNTLSLAIHANQVNLSLPSLHGHQRSLQPRQESLHAQHVYLLFQQVLVWSSLVVWRLLLLGYSLYKKKNEHIFLGVFTILM